jgi:hypothetical protein
MELHRRAESPRGFHPEALTDPDVSLSTYPARVPSEGCRLPSRPSSSSGYPLTLLILTRVTCSLPSAEITPTSVLRSRPPWWAHRCRETCTQFRPRYRNALGHVRM